MQTVGNLDPGIHCRAPLGYVHIAESMGVDVSDFIISAVAGLIIQFLPAILSECAYLGVAHGKHSVHSAVHLLSVVAVKKAEFEKTCDIQATKYVAAQFLAVVLFISSFGRQEKRFVLLGVFQPILF